MSKKEHYGKIKPFYIVKKFVKVKGPLIFNNMIYYLEESYCLRCTSLSNFYKFKELKVKEFEIINKESLKIVIIDENSFIGIIEVNMVGKFGKVQNKEYLDYLNISEKEKEDLFEIFSKSSVEKTIKEINGFCQYQK